VQDELESRAAGGAGPGLAPSHRIDPTLLTAGVFVLLGFTPDAFFDATVGYSHFGPLAWSAILAMVGVLFAVIAVLRSVDTGDAGMRAWAVGVGAVGLLRVFVLAWF